MVQQHFTECFLQYLPSGDLQDISKQNMIPLVNFASPLTHVLCKT